MTEEQKTHTTSSEQELKATADNKPTTKELVLKILTEGGAAYDDYGDDQFGFYYQKEHFVVAISDSMMIRIMDYNWHSVSRWDAEAITDVQTRINKANMLSIAKMVYVYGDDDMMQVSTMLMVPLTADIPDLNQYFVAMLDNVLEMHKFLIDEEEEGEDEGEGDASADREKGGDGCL